MPSPVKTLEELINYAALRNKVISKNIANTNTEGYKREDVQFNDILNNNMQAQLITSENKHFANAPNTNANPEFKVVTDKNSEMASGVNNVDIDKEMASLAENTLLYKFASQKLGDYFKEIQYVIKGGSNQA
jgi:flagellar basal-body rod protein FlgB